MGPAFTLSVSAFSGGVLFLMAVALLVAFPRMTAVRLWAVSWMLVALGCFQPYAPSVFEGLWAPAGLTVRTACVLGALLVLALGFLSWFQVSPDRGRGVLVRTALWGGTVLALVPVALGLTGTGTPAWALVTLWAAVPVSVSGILLVTLGLPRGRGPVRAQSISLLQALAGGILPYTLSWMVLPALVPGSWALGFPPLMVLGAALLFRALVHYDTRFHHHHVSPFLLQKTQDTVLFLQADGRIQALNPAVRVLLDVSEEDLVGQPLSALGADDGGRRLLGPLETLTFPEWEGNLSLGLPSGRTVPVHLVYRRIHNPAREAVGAVLLLYDLRLPRHLDLSSREDLLTTLANRRWVLELLEAEFQRVKRYGGPLTGLWVEVANLGDIEARGGHGEADEVLRRVGAILRAGLRKTDFCGRVGTGEFLAVLPETTVEKAAVVSTRLEKMFALVAEGDGSGAVLRVGLAGLDEDVVSTDDFLARVRDSVFRSDTPA